MRALLATCLLTACGGPGPRAASCQQLSDCCHGSAECDPLVAQNDGNGCQAQLDSEHAAGSCRVGDGGAPRVYVAAHWAMRAGALNDSFDVEGYDGMHGVSASCDAVSSGTTRTVTFAIACGAPLCLVSGAFGVMNASFDGPGSPTATCMTHFIDDGVVYDGACGADSPSSSTPCQITGVQFFSDPSTLLPTVSGHLQCVAIPDHISPGIMADVTAAFSISNCSGLEL